MKSNFDINNQYTREDFNEDYSQEELEQILDAENEIAKEFEVLAKVNNNQVSSFSNDYDETNPPF